MSDRPADGVELPIDDAQPHVKPRSGVLRTRVIPIVALALLAAFIGVLAFALFAPESARPETRRSVNGAIVFNEPRTAAPFTLSTLDGALEISLDDYLGKTVVVNFWASWCEPCIDEMPLLVQASNELGDDVVFLGINTQDELSAAMEFTARLGISYPVLDENSNPDLKVAVEYGVVGVPETYVIGPEGNLVALYRGPFSNMQDIRDIVALAQ